MDLQTVIANKDVIRGMPTDQQQTFLSMAFDRFVQPRLKNLSGTDVDTAKQKWISGFLGKPSPPLPEEMGTDKVPGTVTPTLGQAAAGTAKDVGRLGAEFLGGAGTGLTNVAALPHKLGLIKEKSKSPLQSWLESNAQYFGKIGAPEEKKHPVLSTLAKVTGQFAPGGAAMEGIGEVPEGASAATKLTYALARGTAGATPFAKGPKSLAEQAAIFSAFEAASPLIKAKLLEKFPFLKKKAEQVSTPAVTEEAAKTATPAEVPSDKLTWLKAHGAPGNTVKEGEDWLFDPNNPQKKLAVEYAKATKAVETVPRPVKVKAPKTSPDETEMRRIASEATKLVDLKKAAGSPVLKPTAHEVEQIRAGKSAAEIFNGITPDVVKESPQVTPFAETPEVKTLTVKAAAREFDKLSPAEQHKIATEVNIRDAKVPEQVKPPKVYKLPELGDTLKLRATREEIKNKDFQTISGRINEDAKTLATKIMNSDDSEGDKLSKLNHLYQRQKALLAKVNAGDVGKASGMSKVGKQTAQRAATFGEEAFAKAKAAESPEQVTGSTKDLERQFIELFGREPTDSEYARLETTRSVGESVDQDLQLKFEASPKGKKALGLNDIKSLLPYVAAGGAAYGASKIINQDKDTRIKKAGIGLGALTAWAVTRGKVSDPEVEELALRSAAELFNRLPSKLTSESTYIESTLKEKFPNYVDPVNSLKTAITSIPIVQDLVKGIQNYSSDPVQIANASAKILGGSPGDLLHSTQVEKSAKALVNAVQQSIPDNVRLYRGEYPQDASFIERRLYLKGLKSGDAISFDRITSFSDSKSHAEKFAGRVVSPAHDEHFIFETVGPIKRLNIAAASPFKEEESITFGKFKVLRVSREAGATSYHPITRIHIRQEGVD